MASAALRNGIRVRLLEAMNLGHEVSATSFINQGFGKGVPGLADRTYEQQTADTAYHLRKLEKAKAVKRTKTVRNRGGVEKFYKALARAYFSDEEWAALDLERRLELSRVVVQGLIVQIEGAILTETFDSRTDRWLVHEAMKLDAQGWAELGDANATHYAEVLRIKAEAEPRIEAEGEDAKTIQTTVGILSFESPELPEFVAEEDPATPDE